LEVADNGLGIEPADLKRIFEPFFTTKGPGSSGLGLSIAYNSIDQMERVLSVKSSSGVGTNFTVRFPVSYDEATGVTDSKKITPNISNLHVFLADDEPFDSGHDSHVLGVVRA